MCHTGNRNRFGIFQKKIAPIQVNFLGYAGTTGQEGVDYIISDNFVIPKNHYKYYSAHALVSLLLLLNYFELALFGNLSKVQYFYC